MRKEQEMFDLILGVAKEDERIRAVCMNGSRTNPNVKKDEYQDYDIVYLVNDVNSFLKEPKWIDVFGERLIMQTPDTMTLTKEEPRSRFTYLMQFTDGNRIDLTLVPIEEKMAYLSEDKLTMILLDKDEVVTILQSTDEDYWVKPPTQKNFNDCRNEFYWVSTYVAKGLWRNEILYALSHLNIIREMLLLMIEWTVGVKTNYSVSIGKNGKHLDQYLEQDLWLKLLKTYPNGNSEAIWKSLKEACELFDVVSLIVGNHFDFKIENYRAVLNYIFKKKA